MALRSPGVDDLHLVLGGHAGVHADVLDLFPQLHIREGLQRLPGEGEVPLLEDPHLASDSHRGELVVPGDHDDLDPCLRRPPDRLDGVPPGRIHHPDEAEEDEAGLEDLLFRGGVRRDLPVR